MTAARCNGTTHDPTRGQFGTWPCLRRTRHPSGYCPTHRKDTSDAR